MRVFGWGEAMARGDSGCSWVSDFGRGGGRWEGYEGRGLPNRGEMVADGKMSR